MRAMIVPARRQIDSDRAAPGITTSAACGVEVNLSCDYKTHFPGSRCYTDTVAIEYVRMPVQTCACTHIHTK